MAAPDATKLQVNFKLSDGTLVNIYAENSGELESLLTTIQDTAALISSVSQSLGNTPRTTTVHDNSAGASSAPTSAPSAGGEGGEKVTDKWGNTWFYNLPHAPECANGKMIMKEAISEKTGKPYKGWYDPAAGPQWKGPKVELQYRAKTIWI
jgi:hypothetical protein